MPYQRKRRKLTAEINVVPYIDVMLVLLIIFMVTAPFVTQGVDVELPQTHDAMTAADLADKLGSDEAPSFIIVEVNKDGVLGLSVNNGDVERGLTIQDLVVRVKAEKSLKPNSPVLVGGDGRVPYSEIILTLDALQQAGVGSVGLMTQPIDS